MAVGRKLDGGPQAVLAVMEEWLRVRDRTGRIIPLAANRAQRVFESRRGRQNIILKARQMGMTTWVSGRFFLRTVTRPGTLTLLVAHTQAAAEAIFSNVERMWTELPDDLREGVLRRRRSNAGQMVFEHLDSEFRVTSAADENAGRGLSIQNLHCSEVSRWTGDAAATLAGLRAALAPDGELVLESTPRGAYGAFYDEWRGGVDVGGAPEVGESANRLEGAVADGEAVSASGLLRHFLPWWLEPAYVGATILREAMTADEIGLAERAGLSGEQIGFRRRLERSYGVLRSQEFAEDAETCFRATGSCCFDIEAIERRVLELGKPVEVRRNGALEIYLCPREGRKYCVAVDPAGGGEDGDFAALQVVEMSTGLQCAELRERLRPAELARVAAGLAREYNGAMLAVESNNHGAAVLAYLETSEGYERLYRGRNGEAGWLTTGSSKPAMVACLEMLLRESPERFASRRLLGECRTFRADERGRGAAAAGAHDDLVMAMAIAQAVRAEVLERGAGTAIV